MEDLEKRLRQAEEERAEKTTTMLDADLRPNPNVQELQQKLSHVKCKADKQGTLRLSCDRAQRRRAVAY